MSNKVALDALRKALTQEETLLRIANKRVLSIHMDLAIEKDKENEMTEKCEMLRKAIRKLELDDG